MTNQYYPAAHIDHARALTLLKGEIKRQDDFLFDLKLLSARLKHIGPQGNRLLNLMLADYHRHPVPNARVIDNDLMMMAELDATTADSGKGVPLKK
mgnify:CR=1 FL=1